MPERGRQHHRDENGHNYYRDRGNSRDPYEKSRDARSGQEERGRGSAGDPRPKHDRYKESPVYREHHHAPSTLSREMSMNQSEDHPKRQRKTHYNLRYIPTFSGLCQLMEMFVNLLLIICAGVPYSNNGGYRDLASLGGVYGYYFGGANAFTGEDAVRVKELDRLFHQLKRPPYIFTMACAGCIIVYALAMLCLGVFRVPYRCPPVLLGEALVNFLIGLGYIPALAFYFIKLQETYSDAVCKEREQMYKSKGHKGFECQFHGADIAGGLFGVLGFFLFIFGTVLAIKAFKTVRELKSQQRNENNY
ncbi:MARVEL domain-containing protein 3 [Eucyclogobius newberryi]|uniref:MARVEL domain-containing protein 3 n=1 Tax=Eucyclogobius newberryi TaxID=166745 RepID=UPI003B59BF3B